jgi:hypothetical protein
MPYLLRANGAVGADRATIVHEADVWHTLPERLRVLHRPAVVALRLAPRGAEGARRPERVIRLSHWCVLPRRDSCDQAEDEIRRH